MLLLAKIDKSEGTLEHRGSASIDDDCRRPIRVGGPLALLRARIDLCLRQGFLFGGRSLDDVVEGSEMYGASSSPGLFRASANCRAI